jgi:ADP-ribosyl-[dinitrogen reductase] hydrolase
MNSQEPNALRDRVLGGLWGSLVGDALGVPVEFKDRARRKLDPVIDMRGYGSHHQPAGTWSDDSSLILCTIDSLLRFPFNPHDIGARFVGWRREGLWAAHGELFDIGATTSDALDQLEAGVRAEVAGSADEWSNGNGSLMRIIPVALRFSGATTKELLDSVHRASAITHRHPRSQMACGLFGLVIGPLLKGLPPVHSFQAGINEFKAFYEPDPGWSTELDRFELMLNGDLPNWTENAIRSDGYVIHTLLASLWCLLTTSSFEECVLKAVNLGGDTDTTGCVAGGLAGIHYGLRGIRHDWIGVLARKNELEHLFNDFADLVLSEHRA